MEQNEIYSVGYGVEREDKLLAACGRIFTLDNADASLHKAVRRGVANKN
jgi:hypothetical protein